MRRARARRAFAATLALAGIAPAAACVPWDAGTAQPAVVNDTSAMVLVTVTGTGLDIGVPAGRTWEGAEDAPCAGTAVAVRTPDGDLLAEFGHALCSTTVVHVRGDGSVTLRDYADGTRETTAPTASAHPAAVPAPTGS